MFNPFFKPGQSFTTETGEVVYPGGGSPAEVALAAKKAAAARAMVQPPAPVVFPHSPQLPAPTSGLQLPSLAAILGQSAVGAPRASVPPAGVTGPSQIMGIVNNGQSGQDRMQLLSQLLGAK